MQLNFRNTNWKKIEGKGSCKFVELIGNYKIEGKVLTFPVQGEGKGRNTFGMYWIIYNNLLHIIESINLSLFISDLY